MSKITDYPPLFQSGYPLASNFKEIIKNRMHEMSECLKICLASEKYRISRKLNRVVKVIHSLFCSITSESEMVFCSS